MAAYNHEKFVSQAIQSVLDQTFQDFELIIIDDASTDNTANIIRTFQDSRIRSIFLPVNQGQFTTTNEGIALAQGEYIGILNSDDVFLPDKLEKQIALLDANPHLGAVFTYAALIDERNNPVNDTKCPYYNVFIRENRSRHAWLNYFFYYGNCLCHPSVLIRAACHQTLGVYEPMFANCADYYFWIKLAAKYDIHIIPENLTQFRVLKNDGNMSGESPTSLKRAHWENYLGKRLYFNDLLSDEDFFLAFPEAKKWIPQGTDEAIKHCTSYLLARLAIERTDFFLEAAGLQVLFDLLKHPESAAMLATTYHFTTKDYIRLTGQCNPFQMQFTSLFSMVKAEIRKIPWVTKFLTYIRHGSSG